MTTRVGDTKTMNEALTLYGSVFRAQADFARDVQSFLRGRLRDLKPELAAAGIEIDARSIEGDDDDNEYAYWLSAWAHVERFAGYPGMKGDTGAYVEIAFGWLKEPDGKEQTLPFALVELDWSEAPRPTQWQAVVKQASAQLPPLMYRDVAKTYFDVMIGDEESDDRSHYRTSLDALSRDLDTLVAALKQSMARRAAAASA